MCGGKRRAGEDTRPYGGYRNSCIFCRGRYPHRAVPGRPSVPPLRKETSRIFRRGRTLAGPPMTKDFRYAAGGASPSPTVLQRRTLLWVGKPLGAPARVCARTVSSANPGAAVEPHRVQFWENQAPVGREESRKATQILRAENYLPSPRGNPRNGGPGVRRIWTRSVHPEPSPGDSLVTFSSLRKSLAPQGEIPRPF